MDRIFVTWSSVAVFRSLFMITFYVTTAVGEDDVTLLQRAVAQPRDARASGAILYYSVDEQLPVGTVVADLSCHSSNLTDANRWKVSHGVDCKSNQSRYVIVSRRPRTSNVFTLNSTSGVITTSGVVDRELICSRRDVVCSVTLDVAVQTVDIFDMIRVEVHF
jgi:UPF0288 family protein (methanogenesis marker protein 3)